MESPTPKPLTELQAELVALDLVMFNYVKPFYERRDALMEQIAGEMPIGEMFQADDGTVFEIVVPDGKFVRFEKIGYTRTRRAYLGEKKGSMSMRHAEESGFALGPKQKTIAAAPVESTTEPA